MPTTAIITKDQRDGLYELVRNHLGGIGDVWIALEGNEDFATAERFGIEFGEDFRLLADIGWRPDEGRVDFVSSAPGFGTASPSRTPSCKNNLGARAPSSPSSGRARNRAAGRSRSETR